MKEKNYGCMTLKQLKDLAPLVQTPAGLTIEGPNRKVTAMFAAAASLKDLVSEVEVLQLQRDELLVALKDCLGRLQWLNDPRTGNTEEPWIETAEAAIAKAEQQS